MVGHESFWLLGVNTVQSELLLLVKLRCECQKSSFFEPEDSQVKVIGHERLSHLVLDQIEQLIKCSLERFALLGALLDHFGTHCINIGLDLARHSCLTSVKDKS